MKKTLKKIIEYAVKITEPEQIVLFGSLADDTANVFSDIDLLIVSENPSVKADAIARITNFSKECCLKADVLVYTPVELENEYNRSNSFIRAIIKSGKIVYKKSVKNLELS